MQPSRPLTKPCGKCSKHFPSLCLDVELGREIRAASSRLNAHEYGQCVPCVGCTTRAVQLCSLSLVWLVSGGQRGLCLSAVSEETRGSAARTSEHHLACRTCEEHVA